MSPLKSVLFVTRAADTSHAGFDSAVSLARHHRADLSILVLTSDDIGLAEEVGFAEFNALIEEEAQHRSAELLLRLPEGMTARSVQVRSGKLFIETIRSVLDEKHDIVVKSAESATGLMARLFGSEDMHLLRKCPCPVWLVGPDAALLPKRVLVCVTLDERDGADATLNTRLVDAAIDLLPKAGGAELHVLHLWNAPGEYLVRSPRAGLSARQVEDWVTAIKLKHRSWFNDFLKGFAGRVELRSRFAKGSPEFGIAEVAKEIGADIVVMGTVGRSGISGLLIGNTAETVLGQLECSVLALKPVGFDTPVRPQG